MTKRRIGAIVFFIPALVLGFIGIVGGVISYTLFKLFNPDYKLPDNKAGIDVAPVTKHFWKAYYNYCLTYLVPKGWKEESNRENMHIIN